jgi:hypothetical protein
MAARHKRVVNDNIGNDGEREKLLSSTGIVSRIFVEELKSARI